MDWTQMSVDEWVDEVTVVHIWNGILFALKKEWDVPIWHNIDESEGHNAKWNSFPDMERKILHEFTYVWNLKTN
jgi:hypothetical protein